MYWLHGVKPDQRQPISRIGDLFNQLKAIEILFKISLRSKYYQLEINPEDISKVAFRTKYGHYKFIVMPYGLTNAPTAIVDHMNRVCKAYLGKFMVMFIDDMLIHDMLIYSKGRSKHTTHLRTVLQILKEHQLYDKSKKFKF